MNEQDVGEDGQIEIHIKGPFMGVCYSSWIPDDKQQLVTSGQELYVMWYLIFFKIYIHVLEKCVLEGSVLFNDALNTFSYMVLETGLIMAQWYSVCLIHGKSGINWVVLYVSHKNVNQYW